MRLVLLLAMMALAATPSAALERQAVAGKTIVRSNEYHQRFTETYHAGGALTARSTRRDGSCCISDTGRWWIQDNALCVRYAHWRGGKTVCRDAL
jgi:hypothetical protein